MSLLAQLVDIKPPLKFLLLIFPSLCNSRVCNEKVFSCYHIPLNKGHPDYWDPSWIHVVFIRDSSRIHPGTIQDPHLYSCHESSSTFVATDWLQLYVCTTTCCWHCWLGWTLFFLCFFSGCLSTPFIFICGITTQIAEEYTTSQLACFSLLPAAIEHFVCTLGIEITKPIALKSLMFLVKDISKVPNLVKTFEIKNTATDFYYILALCQVEADDELLVSNLHDGLRCNALANASSVFGGQYERID